MATTLEVNLKVIKEVWGKVFFYFSMFKSNIFV